MVVMTFNRNDMIKIVNSLFPIEDYIAMTVWPFIFIQKKNERLYDDVADNHEHIHGRQQIEMLVVGIILAIGLWFVIGWWCLFALPIFYYWYCIEYLLRSIFGKSRNPYRAISFENEAYINEHDMEYLKHRTPFAWIKYI